MKVEMQTFYNKKDIITAKAHFCYLPKMEVPTTYIVLKQLYHNSSITYSTHQSTAVAPKVTTVPKNLRNYLWKLVVSRRPYSLYKNRKSKRNKLNLHWVLPSNRTLTWDCNCASTTMTTLIFDSENIVPLHSSVGHQVYISKMTSITESLVR